MVQPSIPNWSTTHRCLHRFPRCVGLGQRGRGLRGAPRRVPPRRLLGTDSAHPPAVGQALVHAQRRVGGCSADFSVVSPSKVQQTWWSNIVKLVAKWGVHSLFNHETWETELLTINSSFVCHRNYVANTSSVWWIVVAKDGKLTFAWMKSAIGFGIVKLW